MAQEQQQSNQQDDQLHRALQGWHQAQETAKRHNRNLLQYGAGIAAVTGIGAGSGGILAVANALENAGRTGSTAPADATVTASENANASVTASENVSSIPVDWAFNSLAGAGIAAGCLVFALVLFLLIRALWLRQSAEREADEYRSQLIAIKPELFPPNLEK